MLAKAWSSRYKCWSKGTGPMFADDALTLAGVALFDTKSTRRIEWNGPELEISPQTSKSDDTDRGNGGSALTPLPSGLSPIP